MIHLNKSPMLAPLGTLTDGVKEKLGINLEQCEIHREAILGAGIVETVSEEIDEQTDELQDDKEEKPESKKD